MQNEKKIKYNLIIGIASEILTIILGILVPRLILTSYGSEVNGLLNSVTQIYSYIGLLEAGVGFATIQALYRTVNLQNNSQTNAILSATNHYYHRTGIIYLFTVLIISTSYPVLISSRISPATIILVIIFNGLGNVINFFFQGKYMLLLQAEGKNYIQTSLNMFTNVFKNVAKIILMQLGCDVVFVQMIAMVVSLIQMIYITWYIKRYYAWIDLSVPPDYSSISQSKNVLVHQISGLIFNNTDTLTLTFFCGLKVVSVYSTYTMLFGMVSTALSTVSSSIIFSLGQLFHADRDRFIERYECYEFTYMTLVFALYSVANFFILPFMRLYTAGITDISYIDNALPLLFISTYLLSCGRSAANQVINFAGHFKLTQRKAILESAINLIVSLVAVNYWGIYGVLMGTIAALLYRSNDIILYSNRVILHRSAWKTYKRWLVNLLVFISLLYVERYISWSLDSYFKIILYCIPFTCATLIVFYGVMYLTDRTTGQALLRLLKSLYAKRRNKQ